MKNNVRNFFLAVIWVSVAGTAGCATNPDEPIETFLKPPPPMRGVPMVNRAYSYDRNYVNGLYQLRARFIGQRDAGIEPERSQRCADLLEREIREFPWPGNMIQLEEERRRIGSAYRKAGCTPSPQRATRPMQPRIDVSMLEVPPLPTKDQARARAKVDDYLATYIATAYTNEEMVRIGWQRKRDYGQYLRRVVVPGKDMVQTLMWPRDALRVYCTAHGGQFLDEPTPYGERIADQMPNPAMAASMAKAVERGAFGKKSCISGKTLAWSMFVGLDLLSGIAPDELDPVGATGENPAVLMLTVAVNAGMYRTLWGTRRDS